MYRRALIVSVAAVALAVAGAPSAVGHGGDKPRTHVIESQDDCDPTTFNAALGAGACVGDGETTFDEALEELAEDGELKDWVFDPDELKIRRGDTLEVHGVGGEFHTFTAVAKFGGGCVDEINAILKLSPVAECKDLIQTPDGPIPAGFVNDAVPPGGRLSVTGLDKGSQKFMCLIHPWMHAEVKVRAKH